MISIGVVGFGFMGSTLSQIVMKSLRDRARIVAVCDTDDSALERARSLGQVSLYKSIDDMLEKESLDAVIIATPPAYHAEQAVKALRRGLYVLLEKPMATSLEQAMEIYSNARGKLMMGFSLRFHEMYIEARKLIDESLGAPVFQWHIALGRAPSTPWIADERISGGMINEHAVHVLYVFRWFAGEVRQVFARMWRASPSLGIEDNAALMLVHESGAVSMYAQSWSGGHRWRKWGMQCLRGRATFEGYLGGCYTISIGDRVEERSFDKPVEHMYLNELKHFIDCVENGWRPSPNEVDGIRVQEIVEAYKLSAQRGEPVKLPLLGV